MLDGRVVVDHASDVLGREVTRALPGGGRVESAYDLLGRLERRRAVGLSREVHVRPGEPAWVGPRRENVTVDMAYRYDPVGELGASWDQRRGWTSYQYDPVGQLLARVPEQARAEVFRYDPAGNSHEAGQYAAPREYGHGNQLARKGNTLYRWDAEGRLAEKRVEDPETGARQAWSYTWNVAGLLESVTTPEGERVEFRYDPFGRRVEKRVGKAPASSLQAFRPRSVTRFVWDGDVLVHEISRRARAEGDPVVEVKTYCFEDDGFAPVAHRDDGGWFHYVNDPIGTPERLVDERGEVACELRRDAWGRTDAAPGARTSTPIRFQGQYEDPETGLCYNRFRYYDPDAGRFIGSDPIGLDGGINSFAYANNATGWVDPFGLYKSGPLNPHLLGKDKADKKTKNLTEWRRCVSKASIKSERDKFLGEGHVKVGEGKRRSRDGARQFRVKPDDYQGKHEIGQPTAPNTPHVHYEFLAPNKSGTGLNVTKNVHVPLNNLHYHDTTEEVRKEIDSI
ncbi:RHS repeat-associated core domain-containing protein [Sorangium sp. So ce295]|uniref:RHS repeat domain-containing protein n=1 Tax=Sorangium sp. So ce295 TaxID=3133295 RepID=UPI003F63D16E